MGLWTHGETRSAGGRLQLVISRLTPGGRSVDVTNVRGAATQLSSFSETDPFGDSTASFAFPAITPFDDLHAADLGQWLDYYSNVDLYWVPALAAGPGYDEAPVINALTQRPDVITPSVLRSPSGAALGDARIKLWEGYLAAMDFSADANSAMLEISCQGATFQLDRYLQKPFFPAEPWPLENLILDAFDSLPGQPKRRPHLRLMPLSIEWPAGWGLLVPAYTTRDTYTPVAAPGSRFSGYTSRQTGAWDHALTGFVQDQLTVMITDARSKVTEGNQWTIRHTHASASSPGRAPVLAVRDRLRAPDFALWLGTPGLTARLSGDSTQSENIIYGDGTGVDGTAWRNAVISNDGARTDYLPLAAGRDVFPEYNNPAFVHGGFASEARTSFGTGFDQVSATSVAEQNLARDREPGWTGTLNLSFDPLELPTRWAIRAGMTVLLKGFAGSGEAGVPFHIAAKQANPMEGSIELTVDTRYRDLLTVEEALARTRDPLTPVKMLQVNRASVMIEDIQAPWDYSAGSGYVPTKAKAFFDFKPNTDVFPYTDWAGKHPPLHYPSFYTKCNAGAGTTLRRWAGPVTILTSERDMIARSEFAVYDLFGRLLAIPFHVSLYHVNVHGIDMPFIANNYSPFQDNAFEKVDPLTGIPTPNTLWPQNDMIIGWGNKAGGVLNRAGFWPGRESDGAHPTGQLVDDSTYEVDNTGYSDGFFSAPHPPGQRAKASYISIYAMFYADYHEPVYFLGRLFRQNPGTS